MSAHRCFGCPWMNGNADSCLQDKRVLICTIEKDAQELDVSD